MEPTDLKNEFPDDAQFEAWYRAHLAAPPLRDNGFSQRVLTALPAPRQRSAARRRLFCLVGALLGTGVASVRMVVSESSPVDLTGLEANLDAALGQLASPAFGLALATVLVSLWYVFRPKLRISAWFVRPLLLTGR